MVEMLTTRINLQRMISYALTPIVVDVGIQRSAAGRRVGDKKARHQSGGG